MPQRGNKVALLGAFCLFLSTIEYMIPKPLPFMRLGIANLPLMLALDILPISGFFLLVAIKIFGQALITGSLFSYIFLFSLSGTVLSSFVMLSLHRLFRKNIGFVGIGTAGAMISTMAQIALASVFVFGRSALLIAPPFLAASLVTGVTLGAFCEYFADKSVWMRRLQNFGEESTRGVPEESEPRTKTIAVTARVRCSVQGDFFRGSSRDLFIAGLIMVPSLVFNPSTGGRVVQFLLLSAFTVLTGRKNNVLMMSLMTFGIVFFNLLVPYGQVLCSFGIFRLTKGALLTGIRRAATVQGLFMLSKACIGRDLRIPGKFGSLISESFRIFAFLGQRGEYLKRGKEWKNHEKIVGRIDALLSELQVFPESAEMISTSRSRPRDIAILCATVVLVWMPSVLALLISR
ncbi:MAG: Gx transporter family protein [Treponema sp.]|jgi:heptaprenyl diphosphate synthase|nr:Gx transporter family protein [Treponema sp.]